MYICSNLNQGNDTFTSFIISLYLYIFNYIEYPKSHSICLKILAIVVSHLVSVDYFG